MVETAAAPQVAPWRRRLLNAARSLTSPLLPDDYIGLINPAWSTRELTGAIVRIGRETADTSTVVIEPNFPWPGHRPGQYLRLGVELNGIRHWRAYSITSDPDHPRDLVSVTVKAVDDGKVSRYFGRVAEPGSIVFLGQVEGTFGLPERSPERALFISAGSGITPIMSMLRELARRGDLRDVVHVHCARQADDFIFGPMLRELSARHDGYRLVEHLSADRGRLTATDLDALRPDWRETDTFLSGPGEMIDALQAHWGEHADPSRLRTERFQPIIGTGGAAVGAGGTVRFRVSDLQARCDEGISVLVGGEQAGAVLPFGCRMGICHTCVGRLCEGRLRDLRTGELNGEAGQLVRICVNAPEGHVEIDL